MKQLLVEKYRPKNISEYVFQNKDVERVVMKWINEGEIPNVMLTSQSPGSGKSSLSRILVTELGIDPSDVKTINASLVNGIGFVREELEPWLKKTSFSPFKIVQLEEIDRLSDAAQKALRGITEDYTDRVRFIGTANYANKIIPPLLSRFQHLDMDRIDPDGVLDLVIRVVEGEELTFDNEEDLLSHVDAYMPDMRKILNSIDNHTDSDKVIHPLQEKTQGTDTAAWEDAWESFDGNILSLLNLTDGIDANNFEWFYECMYNNSGKLDEYEGEMLVLCSKYLDRAYRCANQRLHLDAFLYELNMTVSGDE